MAAPDTAVQDGLFTDLKNYFSISFCNLNLVFFLLIFHKGEKNPLLFKGMFKDILYYILNMKYIVLVFLDLAV